MYENNDQQRGSNVILFARIEIRRVQLLINGFSYGHEQGIPTKNDIFPTFNRHAIYIIYIMGILNL